MPPPKRMSDILASSSSSLPTHTPSTTTAPSSSHDPTLPIIPAPSAKTSSTRKRKRGSSSTTAADADAEPHKPTQKETQPQTRKHTNHPSLYTPWTLLPARQRKTIEDRETGEGVKSARVVVWSRNQNVKGGVGMLVGLLRGRTDDDEAAGVIAVSAQGDGVVKLAGIVDVARRVVSGEDKKGDKEGGEEGEATKWFAYISLSSVVMSREDGADGDGDGDADAMQVDTAPRGVTAENDTHSGNHADKQTQTQTQTKTQTQKKQYPSKRIPVLTVWMAPFRIPGFADAFGEVEVFVRGSTPTRGLGSI